MLVQGNYAGKASMLDNQSEDKRLTVGLSTVWTCLLCTHACTYTDRRKEAQHVAWLHSNDLLDDEVQSAWVPQDHACLCNDFLVIITPITPTIQGALTL